MDIYENPSEHYGFMQPTSATAGGSAEEILKPVYYMEEDGLDGGGPMLKVGYGERFSNCFFQRCSHVGQWMINIVSEMAEWINFS